MLEAYDEFYKIAAGDDADRVNGVPAAAFYWTEDPTHYSGLSERIGVFVANEIYKHTGMSLERYLMLPRQVCEDIVIQCSAILERKAVIGKEIISGQPEVKLPQGLGG